MVGKQLLLAELRAPGGCDCIRQRLPLIQRLPTAVQGDGTAQLLCRDAAAQAEVCRILRDDFGMHCMPFTVPPTGGSAPAAHANGSSSGSGRNGSSTAAGGSLQQPLAGR